MKELLKIISFAFWMNWDNYASWVPNNDEYILDFQSSDFRYVFHNNSGSTFTFSVEEPNIQQHDINTNMVFNSWHYISGTISNFGVRYFC